MVKKTSHEINKNDSDAWVNKVAELRQLDRYKNTQNAYDHSLNFCPKEKDAWAKIGGTPDAVDKCEELPRLEPCASYVRVTKGHLLMEGKRFEDALAEFDAALKLNTRDASAHHGRGGALCRLGRWEEGLEEFTTAVRLDPSNTDYAFAHGYACGRLGDRVKSRFGDVAPE